jgi:phosphoglucosamine mutase
MKNLKFGTDGLRGPSNRFPFTEKALYSLGRSIAEWGKKKLKIETKSILILSDTRESCQRIKLSLGPGINSCGLTLIDAGILPTPAAKFLLSNPENNPPGSEIAIVISASHNQYQDNGIKLFTKLGKISDDDESFISNLWNNSSTTFPPGLKTTTINNWPEAQNIYANYLINHFPQNFLKNKKIVLDCANGAAYKVAPIVFEKLGANLTVINNSPNGKNINNSCGSTNPENLIKTMKEVDADAGFAFDGDSDRVISVNHKGEIKDGDDILAMLIKDQEFKNESKVVGTLMSNSGLERSLQKSGVFLIRADVGDKNVANELERDNILLGGEPCGHLIIKPTISSGDGIFVALRLCLALTNTNNWKMNSFQRDSLELLNIRVKEKLSLDSPAISKIIAACKSNLQEGRIVVRYSGTEPLLRIMTEAKTKLEAQKASSFLAKELQKVLNQ